MPLTSSEITPICVALNVCVNTFIPGKISVGGQMHSYV